MKRWYTALLAFLVVASIVGGMMGYHEAGPGHWWDTIPGFYAIFGFIGSGGIIILSRLLGKKIVERDDDYYESKKSESGEEG